MHPWIVRRFLLPLHESILGRPTLAYLRQIEATQWSSLDQLRALQEAKLRRLLAHAHARCPFYRRWLDQAGLDPSRATIDALGRLPVLTKRDISRHGEEMVDPVAKPALCTMTTGGSTGMPLAFKVDRSRQAADQAARARSRRWFGIDLGQRELYLWGSPVEQAAQDRVKRWRDRLTNHRLLNAFKMTPRMMSRYIDIIHRFDPVHLFGYPSSIARLCRHAEASGVSLRNRSLRAVFVTGELFLPADRAVIEEQVGVPVADGYGSREGGFVAHQCPAGAYHVTMESIIVELLDAAGRRVSGGCPGEITITHLDAFGMPFIRYRTGDVALRSSKPCPCGRNLERLERIEGRQTDMLRTADGGYAHALSVIYVLRDEPAIQQFKVIQRPNLDLDVCIVGDGSFNEARRERTRRLLRQQIGQDVDVRLNLVEAIPPDPSGKHRHVVSEAP